MVSKLGVWSSQKQHQENLRGLEMINGAEKEKRNKKDFVGEYLMINMQQLLRF